MEIPGFVLSMLIRLSMKFGMNIWQRWRFKQELPKLADLLVANGLVAEDTKPKTADEFSQVLGNSIGELIGKEWADSTEEKRFDSYVQAALQGYCAHGIEAQFAGKLAYQAGLSAKVEADKLNELTSPSDQ